MLVEEQRKLFITALQKPGITSLQKKGILKKVQEKSKKMTRCYNCSEINGKIFEYLQGFS